MPHLLLQAKMLEKKRKILYCKGEKKKQNFSGRQPNVFHIKQNKYRLVHHSRNSASKQWNETVVLNFNGLMRVFKTFFVFLTTVDDFSLIWQKVLDEIVEFYNFPSEEVVNVCIQSVQDLLLIKKDEISQTLAKSLWESCWSTFSRMTALMTGRQMPTCNLFLVQVLSSLFKQLGSSFGDRDLQRLLTLLRPVAFIPSTSDSNPISEPQKEVFALIEAIPKTNTLFPHVVVELIVYIAQAIGFDYKNSITETDVPQIQTQRSKQFYLFAERTIQILFKTLNAQQQQNPNSFDANVFQDTITILGTAMLTKYQQYQLPLWRTAADSFINIVKREVPMLNKQNDISDVKLNLIWNSTNSVAPRLQVDADLDLPAFAKQL